MTQTKKSQPALSKLPESILRRIFSKLPQQSLFHLLQTCDSLYAITLPYLYHKITLVLTPNFTPVQKLDKFKEFQYPLSGSLISGKKSLKKFFKKFEQSRFNYSGQIVLSNYITSFKVYLITNDEPKYESIGNGGIPIPMEKTNKEAFDFYDRFGEKVYRVEDIIQYQTDCCQNLHYQHINKSLNSTLDKHKKFPIFLTTGVLNFLPQIRDSLADLYLPLQIFGRLIDNNEQEHDFLRNKHAHRYTHSYTYARTPATEEEPNTALQKSSIFLKNQLSKVLKLCTTSEDSAIGNLNLYHIGLCLNLTLGNLTKLEISMSDLILARKVVSLLDSSRVEQLTLYHLGCVDGLQLQKLNDLEKRYEINRQFALIDEFFKSVNVISVFKALKGLKLVFHDGYNRMLVKKFLFALYYLVVNAKKDTKDINKGELLKLKTFEVQEIVKDYSKVKNWNIRNMKDLKKIHRSDFSKSTTMCIIFDLFNTSETFNIRNIINFKTLSKFSLKTNGFLNNFEQKSKFEMIYMNYLNNEVIPSLLSYENLKFEYTVENYDKKIMIPKDVIIVD